MEDQKTIVYPEPLSVNCFPELEQGGIHVWCAFYYNNDHLLRQCCEVLTPAESEYVHYYKFSKDQDGFVVTRGLLRILLSSYLQTGTDELNIARHRKGKPYQLNDPGLFFNISNSGDCCIFAFSRNGEVGIDIEKIRPLDDIDGLITTNFNPGEQDYINSNAEERLSRFVKFWTLKEAFLKAIGEGMRLTPEKLEFSCGDDEFRLRSFAGIVESDDWIFTDLAPDDDYKGTLAHRKSPHTVKMFNFNSYCHDRKTNL
jgi:4'-phosphopantetheinyl transferase